MPSLTTLAFTWYSSSDTAVPSALSFATCAGEPLVAAVRYVLSVEIRV